MKRILVMLIAAAMIFVFCSCGSDEGVEQETQEPVVNLPDNGKKAPSEEIIMEDISSELQTKNRYATVTEVETVKSLTNDGSYEITLRVTAETKYADWTYEADLSYTEYDQGWMLDDVDWIAEEYTVVRKPNASELMDYLNSKFADVDSGMIPNLIPAENGTIDETDSVEDGTSTLLWTSVVKKKHGKYSINCVSYWFYDKATDSWVLSESEETELVEGYAIFYEEGQLVCNVDFSGTWGTGLNQITITDFTGYEFDAEINGEVEHFKLTTNGEGNIISYANDDHWLHFNFGKNETTIVRSTYRNYIDFSCEITSELPELQGE